MTAIPRHRGNPDIRLASSMSSEATLRSRSPETFRWWHEAPPVGPTNEVDYVNICLFESHPLRL